jgi:hypothetical protein
MSPSDLVQQVVLHVRMSVVRRFDYTLRHHFEFIEAHRTLEPFLGDNFVEAAVLDAGQFF